MEKEKLKLALLIFFGWVLIAAGLIAQSAGAALSDIVRGIMTGGGIGIMLLALLIFRKNNRFSKTE
ncbi:hypothetical protein [Paenibacillus sp. MMS20-IR301]|uniref:hypothetical protein n=1 Tax=Paenibacillus sp. MMS20-IR301 TaxID=2895946 RepID=UPI0028EBA761|nr:hypothetical protein [Paenibacillus sp. MMS20-IR301]WNS41721.1 hypothetical protein LOS79_22240 [Paenibacillus sp. MMS20-IR301]